jgi:hypothetical protein
LVDLSLKINWRFLVIAIDSDLTWHFLNDHSSVIKRAFIVIDLSSEIKRAFFAIHLSSEIK